MSKSAVESPANGLAGTTIAALLLAAAQAPLGSTMIAVGLPEISKSLHSDIGLVTSLAVTSYLIVNIIGQSPGGKLGDVLGHLRTARIGILLFAIGAGVGVFANSLLLLVISRCTMALGAALVFPSTVALLRTHVPEARRGRVFGLVGSTMSLSAAIGPPLGGELVSRFGWRAIFFASLPCLAVAVVLVRLAPPPARPTNAKQQDARAVLRAFDWGGSALLSAALASLVIGSKIHGNLQPMVLIGCAVLAVVFVFWELRAKDPVRDPRVFTRGAFTAGSLIIAMQNFAMYGLIFQLPQFFTQIRGATAREVGQILFAMMACMFALSPIGGRSSDRLGPRTSALAGAVLTFIGVLWLRRLGSFMVPSDALYPLMLVGVGLGLGTAPAQTAAMMAVGVEQAGMAAGATSTMRYLGRVVSILMLSGILGGAGAMQIAAHESAVTAFATASGLAVLMCLALPGTVAGSKPIARP